MSEQGYIYLERKIRDHWVWEARPYSPGQAWIDIILMVNHKDSKMFFDGRLITVKRGSCITSIRKLGERWGWKRDKVSEFLKALEADCMIRKQSNNRRTLLTVQKYSVYQQKQGRRSKKSDSKGDTKGYTLGYTPGDTLGSQTSNDEVMISKESNKGSPIQDEIGNPWDEEGWE